MDGVQYKTRRTHVVVPEDNESVLQRITAIDERIKTKGKEATISDEELDDLLRHLASQIRKCAIKVFFLLIQSIITADGFNPSPIDLGQGPLIAR